MSCFFDVATGLVGEGSGRCSETGSPIAGLPFIQYLASLLCSFSQHLESYAQFQIQRREHAAGIICQQGAFNAVGAEFRSHYFSLTTSVESLESDHLLLFHVFSQPELYRMCKQRISTSMTWQRPTTPPLDPWAPELPQAFLNRRPS